MFPEALSDLWQCVDPAPSEHINEAAMNFVFTAFFATIFISGMLCVLSCVSCA